MGLEGNSKSVATPGIKKAFEDGVMDLVTHLRDKVPSVVTLPQRFREAGYAHGSACRTFKYTKNKIVRG